MLCFHDPTILVMIIYRFDAVLFIPYILSSPKKTQHPVNKFIYFAKLMKISTMMDH